MTKRERRKPDLFEAKADSDRPKPATEKAAAEKPAREAVPPLRKQLARTAHDLACSSSSSISSVPDLTMGLSTSSDGSSSPSAVVGAAEDEAGSEHGAVRPGSELSGRASNAAGGDDDEPASSPAKPRSRPRGGKAAEGAAPARSRSRGEAGPSSSVDAGDGACERPPEQLKHRQSMAKRQQVMRCLEPVQQLLMLGFIPDEADQEVWADFGTLANGKVEIRPSRVQTIVGENALGRGLFACQDFAFGDIITVYGGELITDDEAKLRRDTRGSQSHRYLMRISDSDFLVDGWQYASGISETTSRGGVFLPTHKFGTQYSQGAGPMANHDIGLGANAQVSFLPLANSEAFRLFPRVPTLRAIREIKTGEEIRFNYGSSLPFCPEAPTAGLKSEKSFESADAQARNRHPRPLTSAHTASSFSPRHPCLLTPASSPAPPPFSLTLPPSLSLTLPPHPRSLCPSHPRHRRRTAGS